MDKKVVVYLYKWNITHDQKEQIPERHQVDEY